MIFQLGTTMQAILQSDYTMTGENARDYCV